VALYDREHDECDSYGFPDGRLHGGRTRSGA
jgi:hypothetical protein